MPTPKLILLVVLRMSDQFTCRGDLPRFRNRCSLEDAQNGQYRGEMWTRKRKERKKRKDMPTKITVQTNNIYVKKSPG